MKGLMGVVIAIVVIVAIAGGSHGGSSSQTSTATPPPPKPTISKGRAEAVFHRAVAEVAKGGLIQVGRIGTVETTCEPKDTHWSCFGWFIAEGPFCLTVGANVNNAGHVGKETYGKLPLGEPGVSECKL